MTLAAKLVEVMKEVRDVKKLGKNVAQSYDYVKASDVAAPLRAALATRGVIMIPDVVEAIHFSATSAKGTVQQGIHIKVLYTFVNAEDGEKLQFHGYGSGMDTGDKAIYKAHTGALKYALRIFFMLPDDKAEPEYSNKSFGDTVKPFVMSATVKSAASVKGDVYAQVSNKLGEFIWRVPKDDSDDATKLKNAEGEERDAMVIDTGNDLKGKRVFRVVKLDPKNEDVVRLTKGEVND